MLVYVVLGLVAFGAMTSHTGGGPPTAATEIPTEQVDAPGGGLVLLVLAVVIAVWAFGRSKRSSGRPTSGRMVAGHFHGGPSRTIARHEAGHAAAARALGGRVLSATADRRGGYVHASIPDSPRAAITFLRAGRRAAGTGAGCSADDRAVRDELRSVPRAEHGQVFRDADRDARRIVNRNRGQIQRDARTLAQRGRL